MSYLGHYLGSSVGKWWGYSSEIINGGSHYDLWSYKKTTKKKAKETLDKISEIAAEFAEKPYSEVYEKAAYQEITTLAAEQQFIKPIITEFVPMDNYFITYEQIQAILQAITTEYLKLKLLADDEDVIIALYAN